MTVRVGTDVGAALAVWTAVERAASQPPGAGRTTRMRTRLRSATALHLVAGGEVGGDPVIGLLLLEIVHERMELALVCVHPERQREGLGRALVAAALDRYPTLTTWSAQPETCEALGLRRTGVVRDDGAVALTR